MRDDEDNIRQYMPVLRRIIILVAVLTAIPVAMWTITAFVRTYIGPLHAPSLRPMAVAPANPPTATAALPADQSPPDAAGAPKATSSVLVAHTGTPDSAGAPASADRNGPADATPTGTAPPFKTASVGAPPNAAPDDARPSTASPQAYTGSGPANSAAPGAAPDSGRVEARQPDSASWPSPPAATASAMQPGDPISGPVPLPRKRPATFAMAGSGVPLPAPRPDTAGPGAADASPTAIDWLKKVFHPATQNEPAPDSGTSQ